MTAARIAAAPISWGVCDVPGWDTILETSLPGRGPLWDVRASVAFFQEALR